MTRFASPIALATLFCQTAADFLAYVEVENDVILPEEIYDTVELERSSHWYTIKNTTKYYCIMRGLWSPQSHPAKFPQLARMSNPLIYSSTKEFRPWLLNRQTTVGVEKVAEFGFTDTLRDEIAQAGRYVFSVAEGNGFFVDKVSSYRNIAFLPPVTVNYNYPFLSGISSMQPSPDWYTGFYLLDVIDQYERTYWNRIKIRTYPWDAGTDGGTSYTSIKEDMGPPLNVERIYARTAPPGGIFLNHDGNEILPVAEWDCMLHVCPGEEEDCCEKECNPAIESPCRECKPKATDGDRKVYYSNCCLSNYDPAEGDDCFETFEFSGLSMHLVGVGNLTSETESLFEETLEHFYLSSFWRSEFWGVGTRVTVDEQSSTQTGNTVTYNQSVFFDIRVYAGVIDETTARSLVESPFEDDKGEEEYSILLRKTGSPAFTNVTVTDKVFSRKGNGNAAVIVPIVIALLVGIGASIYFLRRRYLKPLSSHTDLEEGVDPTLGESPTETPSLAKSATITAEKEGLSLSQGDGEAVSNKEEFTSDRNATKKKRSKKREKSFAKKKATAETNQDIQETKKNKTSQSGKEFASGNDVSKKNRMPSKTEDNFTVKTKEITTVNAKERSEPKKDGEKRSNVKDRKKSKPRTNSASSDNAEKK